jgi:hypothetical protein
MVTEGEEKEDAIAITGFSLPTLIRAEKFGELKGAI